MEDENENVQLGKLLDENSYKRDDKHIEIDGIINIDFIHDNRELHEIKKSRAVEEAGIWQLKYYLYYLEERGVKGIKGRIDYPLLKRTMEVALSDEDRNVLGDVIKDINILKKQNMVPQLDKKKICSKCAYYDLCYI